MSDVKQCDRCGALIIPFKLSAEEIEKDYWRYDVTKDCHPYERIIIDLCYDCKKDLVEWLQEVRT